MPQAHREADQTEKAYQKQDAVFLGRKRTLAKKSKKGLRYVRNVGLGFKTPKLALEGSYVDKKCPFTGNVSIRGRILKGMVISTKMTRTVVIRRDYLNWCGKYRTAPCVFVLSIRRSPYCTQAVSRRDIRTCRSTSRPASRMSRRATS